MAVILQRATLSLSKQHQVMQGMWAKLSRRGLSGVPELTRVRYPDVRRGNYAKLQEDDKAAFSEILDQNRVITEESDLEGEYFEAHKYIFIILSLTNYIEV